MKYNYKVGVGIDAMKGFRSYCKQFDITIVEEGEIIEWTRCCIIKCTEDKASALNKETFIDSLYKESQTHNMNELLMSILDIEKKLEVADSVSLPFVGLEELETFFTDQGWEIDYYDTNKYTVTYLLEKDNKIYILYFDYYEGSILIYKKIEQTA